MNPLRPEALTWTALLSKWIEYAQASLSLQNDQKGTAWKASVVPIIELQAITFALVEITELPAAEKALACDKSEILIQKARKTLKSIWNDQTMPESVSEIVSDAELALTTALRIQQSSAPTE